MVKTYGLKMLASKEFIKNLHSPPLSFSLSLTPTEDPFLPLSFSPSSLPPSRPPFLPSSLPLSLPSFPLTLPSLSLPFLPFSLPPSPSLTPPTHPHHCTCPLGSVQEV